MNPTKKLEQISEQATQEDLALKYKIGDRVTFTNEFGVVFKGHKVTGFFKPELNEGIDARMYRRGYRYYIDSDAPWMPKQEASLTVEN